MFIHKKEKGLKVYEIFVSMCTIILFGRIWFISVLNLCYYEILKEVFPKKCNLYTKTTYMHNIQDMGLRCVKNKF